MKTEKRLLNCDISESSDDDIPLSTHKSNKQGNVEHSQKSETKVNTKKFNLKRKNCNKIAHQYKNGKRVFCRLGNANFDLFLSLTCMLLSIIIFLDSESSDFEKYTYFDENKTKRKIKLPPDLSLDDLKNQIENIKIENMCLIEEHKRIDQIKLKERLKLRMEIARLKSCIAELKVLRKFLNSLYFMYIIYYEIFLFSARYYFERCIISRYWKYFKLYKSI